MTPSHLGSVIELHTEIIFNDSPVVSQEGSEKYFLNTTGPYTHKLTVAGVTCTKHFCMGMGRLVNPHPWLSQFSLQVWLLVGHPCSSAQPHTQEDVNRKL